MLGTTRCTLFAFPRIALINCKLQEFLCLAFEDMPRTGDRNLAEKPSKQSCYTLSNSCVGWESLLEIGHSNYCCKQVPGNRLVFLQPSHI